MGPGEGRSKIRPDQVQLLNLELVQLLNLELVQLLNVELVQLLNLDRFLGSMLIEFSHKI